LAFVEEKQNADYSVISQKYNPTTMLNDEQKTGNSLLMPDAR